MKLISLQLTIGLSLLLVPVAALADWDPSDLDSDGIDGVREPGDGNSSPGGIDEAGVMFIDRSHGQWFDVSGFTDYLISEGWTVIEIEEGPITEDLLAPCDVLMLPIVTYFVFTESELDAVLAFVADGKGLWVFHDYECDATEVNLVASQFGVSFYADMVRDYTDNEGHAIWPTIHLLEQHCITEGVSEYGYYAGCCLSVSEPAIIVGMGDDDAFSAACPSYPPVMAVYEGTGRAVFSGDNTPLYPGYYPGNLDDEEELLLQNIAAWLLGSEPTALQQTTWGEVKSSHR